MGIFDGIFSGGENEQRRKRIAEKVVPGAGIAYNAGRVFPSVVDETVKGIGDGIPSALSFIHDNTAGPAGEAIRGLTSVGKGAINFVRGLNNAGPLGSPSIAANPAKPNDDPYGSDKTLRGSIGSPPVQQEAAPIEAQPIATQPIATQGIARQPIPQRNITLIKDGARSDRLSELSKPIDSINADNYRGASTALGGLSGAMLALGGIGKLNQLRNSELKTLTNEDQRGVANALNTFSANTQSANTGIGAFNAQTGAIDSQVRSRLADAGIAKTNVDTERDQLSVNAQKELSALRAKLLAEPDQQKRKALQETLLTVMGKNPPDNRFQIVNDDDVDANGIHTKVPYIINSEDGSVRRAIPLPPITSNPKAVAISKNDKLSHEEKKRQLMALGYQ